MTVSFQYALIAYHNSIFMHYPLLFYFCYIPKYLCSFPEYIQQRVTKDAGRLISLKMWFLILIQWHQLIYIIPAVKLKLKFTRISLLHYNKQSHHHNDQLLCLHSVKDTWHFAYLYQAHVGTRIILQLQTFYNLIQLISIGSYWILYSKNIWIICI